VSHRRSIGVASASGAIDGAPKSVVASPFIRSTTESVEGRAGAVKRTPDPFRTRA
jgi:hypothetical protein